jgi:hypothetical protein
LYKIKALFKADLAKKGLVSKRKISLSYASIAFSFSPSRLKAEANSKSTSSNNSFLGYVVINFDNATIFFELRSTNP